jgi:hypothetical protein
MKFIILCDRTGMVECEIFAEAFGRYGLNTVRYPVVQVMGQVKPFDNGKTYTLEVGSIEWARKHSTGVS